MRLMRFSVSLELLCMPIMYVRDLYNFEAAAMRALSPRGSTGKGVGGYCTHPAVSSDPQVLLPSRLEVA